MDKLRELMKRAEGWKPSDLRKYPTATLELIDSLRTALEAALRQQTPAVGDTRYENLKLMAQTLEEMLNEIQEICVEAKVGLNSVGEPCGKLVDAVRELADRAKGQPDTPPTPREGLADKLERQFRPGLIPGTKFTEGYQTCLNDLRMAERAAGQTSGEASPLPLDFVREKIWQSCDGKDLTTLNFIRLTELLNGAEPYPALRAALGQTSTAPERKL